MGQLDLDYHGNGSRTVYVSLENLCFPRNSGWELASGLCPFNHIRTCGYRFLENILLTQNNPFQFVLLFRKCKCLIFLRSSGIASCQCCGLFFPITDLFLHICSLLSWNLKMTCESWIPPSPNLYPEKVFH